MGVALMTTPAEKPRVSEAEIKVSAWKEKVLSEGLNDVMGIQIFLEIAGDAFSIITFLIIIFSELLSM
jgi:hypothetical protein